MLSYSYPKVVGKKSTSWPKRPVVQEVYMYQRTVLPNGVRIITEHVPYLRSVTLGAWFEAGSRHEKPHQWGIAHFIEHMMFKGTANHSAREIAEIIDQRGGD